MPSLRAYRRKQRGDTIIEVLIAVAIVSLVLTSAYMLTNRNKAIQQTAQEQSVAQKLAERQVELLRGKSGLITSPSQCLSSAGVQSGSQCIVDASGNVVTVGYALAIARQANGSFRVTARWQTVNGSTATVTMYYYDYN